MLMPFFHNSGIMVCWMFVYENRETSNTEIPKCGSHLFLSRISEICVCQGLDTGTREVSNPEIPNCGTHLPFFAFRRFVYMVVWALALTKSRTPNSRSTNHLSFFSGVVACLTFLFTKIRTPKPRSTRHLVAILGNVVC
jgi:hypothetical protein